MSIGETARTGDRLETLRALRDRLADEIDAGPEPRDLAALSTRLERVLEQIGELGDDDNGDIVDELRSKRAERLAATGSEGG